ncbi:MAG: RDD family protein [Pseudoxanthomonas suwonensis]|nr:MAG: RDD family protein [Pseudoxanthomonas suwonensis]
MNTTNPYSAPQSDVVLAQDGTHQLAGRGIRLLAAIIDTVILLVIMVPLMLVGGYIDTVMSSGGQVPFFTILMWTLIGFAVFAVVQGFPLNANGQTWGKRALGIRIVDLQGNKPPLGKLLGLRYLPLNVANAIPMVGPLLGLVNVLLIFRADRRCGHDLIAGTQVVSN